MVAIYVGTTVFLGSHVRHGFWSMFQSLGLMKQSRSKALYAAGLGVGLVLAVGFLALPIVLYFRSQGV
jgi:succinate dehydrogenase / fumarate reductase cytochrome b subunit